MKQNSKLLRNTNQTKAKDNNEITHRKGKNPSKDIYKRCVNLKMLYGKEYGGSKNEKIY